MATIVSRYRTTVAMMNSIHDLLSENHPCTLFMASLHPGYHEPQFRQIITFSGEGGALSARTTAPCAGIRVVCPAADLRGRRTYCGCTPDAANRVGSTVM